MTALHWAMKKKQKEAVLWLLEQGARNDIADAAGKTPQDYDYDGLIMWS